MSRSSKEKAFVSIMYALSHAFKTLYYEDCITITVNPYSLIRVLIDGAINGLRPDSSTSFSYRVSFLDDFDIDKARINIILNLLDKKGNTFNIGFMSDWKLSKNRQTISIDNYSALGRKIIFQEKKAMSIFEETLFTDLTQMIKGLVRDSIKKLG